MRRPAIVQERSCRKATIVRTMLAMLPSTRTGLDAIRPINSGLETLALVAQSLAVTLGEPGRSRSTRKTGTSGMIRLASFSH
jgi:hypothetical protein